MFEPPVEQQQLVFEPPIHQQSVFEPPTSDDYYTSDTPPLEFPFDGLMGDTTDEIGGTQLTGAPPVTQPMQLTQ
jgi:hypothetical protein